MDSEKTLTTYCGLYCPGCALYQGKVAKRADSLRRLISSYELDKSAEVLAAEDSRFANFSKLSETLGALSEKFGDCAGCRNGGGSPNCDVRSCAQDRGYSTCSDCTDMESCGKLDTRPWARPSLKRIRDEGYDDWIKTKQDMVEAGWSFLLGDE
ncbi:MAG: DUF3795 domain-containing protein [Candidatus Thorarchaeota archaeon]